MKNNKDHDLIMRLLIIGNSSVGKTCLLRRFSEGVYQDSFIPTIGIDIAIKKITIDNKKVKIRHFWRSVLEAFRVSRMKIHWRITIRQDPDYLNAPLEAQGQAAIQFFFFFILFIFSFPSEKNFQSLAVLAASPKRTDGVEQMTVLWPIPLRQLLTFTKTWMVHSLSRHLFPNFHVSCAQIES